MASIKQQLRGYSWTEYTFSKCSVCNSASLMHSDVHLLQI